MNEIQDIGKQLVEYSQDSAAFSAQRGILDDLFPYIFEASKRMSLRAIGRWLQSEHQITISATSLAKAMRNAHKYWIQNLEEIEPSVRIVARAHKVSPSFVMSSENVIRRLEGQIPTLAGDGDEGARIMWEYDDAVAAIKAFWSWMPTDACSECLAQAEKYFEVDDDMGPENDGGKHERTDERKDG